MCNVHKPGCASVSVLSCVPASRTVSLVSFTYSMTTLCDGADYRLYVELYHSQLNV